MTKIFSFFTAAIFILFYSDAVAQTAITNYTISKLKVGGDGAWDNLSIEDARQRLFVSHGNEVQVLDLKSGQLIDSIPGTKGVHGIAIATELNRGFISNGKDTSVTVFDLFTLKTLSNIKVTGINPDAILYDLPSRKVFVFNGRRNNVTVIDGKSEKIIATISIDGKPGCALSDGAGNVYFNILDKSKIGVINTSTLKVENNWPIAPGKEPGGLALDNKNHRLFAACANKLMVVVDAINGKVVTNMRIGENAEGVVFDEEAKRVYSSNGEGTLTIIQEDDPDNFRVLQNLTTQKGARTITMNPTTHHLYLPTAEFGPQPAPTEVNPHPHPAILPGTFVILDIKPESK